MKRALKSIYYFLPVQLLFLHFRKSQLLLSFWLIIVLIITGNFAAHFGASSLLLVPEYLGQINFMSMFLLGAAQCVFIMSWHITTFIMHSKRLPYMGATRHAFMVYCINNCIIPVAFLIFYSVVSVRYLYANEHAPLSTILFFQLGYYLGFLVLLLISFAYFFRVSRDFFKNFLDSIAKPSRLRKVIPYDALDYELDMIEAETFISGKLRIEKSTDLAHYHPRVMSKIMNRHHRNVIFAAFFSYLLLLVMGVYMEVPFFRIPAGAGFLLLFAIVMGFVGAFKYFMRSWEAIGWVIFALLLSVMVHYKLFDLRSIAYGLNYQTPEAQRPVYNYTSLKEKFTPQRYYDDQFTEEKRLKKWKKASGQNDSAVMVIIISSGGGSRSSYWTLHCLQYLDSLSNGNLFKKTVLISGASGGMIGASYWRGIHDACQQNLLKDPYDHRYLNNMGKDLLNSIIFSFASVDLISPFNKISLAGYSYTRDRGYAMEQEMIANTEGVLDHNFRYFKDREAAGQIPQLVVNSTVVNDGRKLMMSSQPISYLTMPSYALKDPYPVIDAIDYSALFEGNDPLNLRLTSALRMNATFPFVLPVVRLPTNPYMNIMDAGLRDNFGVEIANRYVQVLSNWIRRHVKSVIVLEVRDTREYDVSDPTTESSLGNMMVDPFFAIQNKWECFQSYKHAYIKDHVPGYIGNKIKYFTLAYVPREQTKYAALNFHLTRLEKEDLYESLFIWENKHTIDSLAQILR